MTRWRWVAMSEDIDLMLTLDSDDPETIKRVETSAKANGITLVRIAEDEGWPTPSNMKDWPAEYWESQA